MGGMPSLTTPLRKLDRIRDFVNRGIHLVEDALRPREEDAALDRRLDAMRLAHEQGHAELRFELLDGDRQRGLRHMQRLCGAREAAEARDREAVAQCTDVHTESLFGG